jgi:excisionase family DNA binding protein
MPRLKKKWSQVAAAPAAAVAPPEYMNLKRASEYLGVGVWTIRRLIDRKLLTAKRVGKYFIVRRFDIDDFWQNLEPVKPSDGHPEAT